MPRTRSSVAQGSPDVLSSESAGGGMSGARAYYVTHVPRVPLFAKRFLSRRTRRSNAMALRRHPELGFSELFMLFWK